MCPCRAAGRAALAATRTVYTAVKISLPPAQLAGPAPHITAALMSPPRQCERASPAQAAPAHLSTSLQTIRALHTVLPSTVLCHPSALHGRQWLPRAGVCQSCAHRQTPPRVRTSRERARPHIRSSGHTAILPRGARRLAGARHCAAAHCSNPGPAQRVALPAAARHTPPQNCQILPPSRLTAAPYAP